MTAAVNIMGLTKAYGEKTVLNKYELFRADLDNAVGNAV